MKSIPILPLLCLPSPFGGTEAYAKIHDSQQMVIKQSIYNSGFRNPSSETGSTTTVQSTNHNRCKNTAHLHTRLGDILPDGRPHSDASTQQGGCISRVHVVWNLDSKVAGAPELLSKAPRGVAPSHDGG